MSYYPDLDPDDVAELRRLDRFERARHVRCRICWSPRSKGCTPGCPEGYDPPAYDAPTQDDDETEDTDA